MGWFGKLTFGSLGLFFGGPLGAIAGAALGHHLIDKNINMENRVISMGKTDQAQASYFVCVFSILGKLAKADGTVTRKTFGNVQKNGHHPTI